MTTVASGVVEEFPGLMTVTWVITIGPAVFSCAMPSTDNSKGITSSRSRRTIDRMGREYTEAHQPPPKSSRCLRCLPIIQFIGETSYESGARKVGRHHRRVKRHWIIQRFAIDR